MIDTIGYGIHDMNSHQAKRYLLLPGMILASQADHLWRCGRSCLQPLNQNTNLSLVDMLALDRIKKLPIADKAVTRLKRAGQIEGRKPNFHVSAHVAGRRPRRSALAPRMMSSTPSY